MKITTGLALIAFGFNAYSASYLAEEALNYEVLFTNPECRTYRYTKPVETVSGDWVEQKPQNAFCSSRDRNQWKSRRRDKDSPQKRLKQWIDSPDTEEVFVAYLSYSNSVIHDALCDAANQGAKVRLVMDRESYAGRPDKPRALARCGSKGNRAEVHRRGHSGSGKSKIGWAHNKVTIINPDSDVLRIAFSSGNLSSGVHLHHENWHFVTVPRDTYFAQVHLCLMNAQLDERVSGGSSSTYARWMDRCRANIEYEEEQDMSVYFIPNSSDTKRLRSRVSRMIENARDIKMAAHRLTAGWILNGVKNRRSRTGGILRHTDKVQLIVDDDIHWIGQGEEAGANSYGDFRSVDRFLSRGGSVKFMETNHFQSLLHHNKFILAMNSKSRGEVLAGAANFTDTAFGTSRSMPLNFENIYITSIPSVVKAFRNQFRHMWSNLATAPEDLPLKNVMPTR